MPPAELTMRRWLVRTQSVAGLTLTGIGLAVVVVALVVAGGGAARSCLAGVLDIGLFFGLGALVDLGLTRAANATGMMLLLAGYGLRIVLATFGAFALLHFSLVTSPAWFGVGAVVGTLAWVTGLFAGHLSARWPLFDVATGVGA